MSEIKIIPNKNISAQVNTTIAIIAYITFIGTIIAYFLNKKKTGETKSFGAFHLRQATGLYLYGLIALILLSIIGSILSVFKFSLINILLIEIIRIAIFILAIIGIINASNRKRKELHFIGFSIQNIFGNAFE